MKKRYGFVSNSSSSSFVIAYKDGVKDDEIRNKIKEYLILNLDEILDDMVELILDNNRSTAREILDDDYLGDRDKDFITKGYTNFIKGYASDDGDKAEEFLCNAVSFDFDDGTIAGWKEASY